MQPSITLKLRKPIRDDFKAGTFLNRKLNGFSSVDYRKYECYYIGDPIQVCISFFNYIKVGNSYIGEVAIAGEDFAFNKKNMRNLLALFFENSKYTNTRLQALIPVWNKQALRLCELSGFSLEGRLREVAKDGDRFVYSLLKREFVSKYVGNIRRSTTDNHNNTGLCSAGASESIRPINA